MSEGISGGLGIVLNRRGHNYYLSRWEVGVCVYTNWTKGEGVG